MRFLLIATSTLFGLLTLVMLAVAKSAVHEILAAVCALTSVSAFGMAAIVDAIRRGPDLPPGD